MSVRTLSQQKLSTQIVNKTGTKLIGYASVAFSSSTGYATINKNSGLLIGSQDFCVEMWHKTTSGGGFWFGTNAPGGDFQGVTVGISGSFYWYLLGCNGSWTTQRTSGTVTTGVWRHIAITRSSGTCKFFVNGTQTDSWSDSGSITQPASYWAVGGASGYQTTGSISNLRVVVGSPVYTSGFTVPTAPLTAISGTKLLTCNSAGTIADSSGNSTFATTAGTPGTDNPFA